VGTVSVAAVFFVFMSYAFSIGYGKKAVGEAAWAFSPSVMDDLGTKYIGSWYAGLLDLIVILDATALALAICVMVGRGFFALGRDGLLPKVFAKTSRHDTPWVGNLMVAVGGIGLLLIVGLTDYLHRFLVPGPDGKLIPAFPDNQFAVFILSATIGSFAIELVYLALAVFAFRLVRQGGNKPWQYVVVAAAVATPILGFYGALSPSPHDRSSYNWEAAYWTVGLIVVALVWFSIVVVTRRANVDNAAAHAAERHGVPPLDETLGFQPTE
jgi:amino acid transporter